MKGGEDPACSMRPLSARPGLEPCIPAKVRCDARRGDWVRLGMRTTKEATFLGSSCVCRLLTNLLSQRRTLSTSWIPTPASGTLSSTFRPCTAVAPTSSPRVGRRGRLLPSFESSKCKIRWRCRTRQELVSSCGRGCIIDWEVQNAELGSRVHPGVATSRSGCHCGTSTREEPVGVPQRRHILDDGFSYPIGSALNSPL